MSPTFFIFGRNYTQRSAGCRALHRLCHELNEMGETAYIYPRQRTNPHWNEHNIDLVDVMRYPGPKIAIYPEVVGTEMFGSHVVARWLLNTPGKSKGVDASSAWGKDDLKFHWSEVFVSPEDRFERLCLPLLDRSIFYDSHQKRSGSLVYSFKAKMHGVEPPSVWPNIGDQVMSHRQIADLLRKTETLYICEHSSIASEAIACGCKVEYVLSDYMPVTPPEWVEPTEEETKGMLNRLVSLCKNSLNAKSRVHAISTGLHSTQ